MNKNNRFMLMLAPDGDTSSASPAVVETLSAPGIDVPVLESPIGGDIQDVTIANIETTESGVKSPQDLWGEDPNAEMEAAQAKMEGTNGERERGPDGKFLPKKKDSTELPAKPVAGKVVKPAVKPAVAKVEAEKEVASVVNKLKIGDTEKTAEEWAQELAELRAKAEQPKPPENTAEAALDPKAAQEQAAEEEKQLTERRQSFLEKASERYTPTEAELDTILAGGPAATKALAGIIAKSEMNSREAAANMFNQEMNELEKRLAPILEREKTIAKFQEENTALTTHPELKANPKGIEIYRRIKGEFDSAYQGIQSKGDAATPQEKAWAMAYTAQTPEGLRDAIANHAKAEVAKLTPVAGTLPVKPANGVIQQVTKPAAPRPTRPFKSDIPGVIASPKQESSQSRFVREMGMDA